MQSTRSTDSQGLTSSIAAGQREYLLRLLVRYITSNGNCYYIFILVIWAIGKFLSLEKQIEYDRIVNQIKSYKIEDEINNIIFMIFSIY